MIVRKLTSVLSCLGFAATTLLGCSAGSEGIAAGEDDAVASAEQALIGGQPAAATYFRSTVGIGDVCTAAKVGPRLFLTAAHCVSLGRPGRGQPVPDGFPANNGVADKYLPGKPLLMHWGLDVSSPEQGTFTIVNTTIHPSWWACPLCQDQIRGSNGAADIAVIQIAQDTPQIPQARVELDAIAVGAQVVKVGWGCEERTNVDPSTVHLGRYKAAPATVIPVSQIRHDDSPLTDSQVAAIDSSYLITAGRAQNANNGSLCLGDSGGPLYLANNADPRVVGINADYTFPPAQEPDLGGVSWTDWHTRTAKNSLHGVGQWLVGLGVNTVGGQTNPNCTCAKGCNAIKTATVPFTRQGPDDSCYFFQNLGYSVNSHSMVEVNVNGRNITNQWLGNWGYPAKRDGGYYLYRKGALSWSWTQVLN